MDLGSPSLEQQPKSPDPRPSTWRGSDTVALTLALALIAVSALVGWGLKQRGLPIVLSSPPLLSFWRPHAGWGTPLAILCLVAGLRLQQRMAALLGAGSC